MAYIASKKQALAHKAFMVDGFKRGVLLWGRQSGKTFFSTQHSWISAVLEQGRYFVVFKTYKQAHEVVWRQYIPLIPKEIIFKKNEQDLLIELHYLENTSVKLPSGETVIINHDKNKPRSTIQLLGSDQADSHRGFRADGMIFDEYADQDPDNFKVVYEPMFSTTNGWIIFMGTPRGYNHFYDLIQFAKEDEKWFYQEATWRDSPYVNEEFMANVKAEAIKRGLLSGFMQEYELEFRSVQGAVYPIFDRNLHGITPLDIPQDLTYYGAIDFGWHTTAFLLLGVDKDQTWYVVDEVYGKEETLDNLIPRIKAVIGDKRIVLMVGDSANRDAIEVMQRTFPVVGVNKANDAKGYATGIGLVTEKLKPRQQLIGLPKPGLYIGKNCKHLTYEIESYRFPEEKSERNPSDIPIKEDDHGCFIAGTLVDTTEGDIPIEQIKAGDYVVTPYGKSKVLWAGKTGKSKPVYEFMGMRATAEHPFITQRGVVRMDALRYTDSICIAKTSQWMELSSGGILNQITTAYGLIICLLGRLREKERSYTSMFGKNNMVVYPKGIISIIKMATRLIINWKTWSVLPLQNIKRNTGLSGGKLDSMLSWITSPLGVSLPPNGMVLPKGLNYIAGLAEKVGRTGEKELLRSSVSGAARTTKLHSQTVQSSATSTVELQPCGNADVYGVETEHGVYTVDGILIGNCDAIRYLFLHLKYGLAKKERPLVFEMEKTVNEYGLL